MQCILNIAISNIFMLKKAVRNNLQRFIAYVLEKKFSCPNFVCIHHSHQPN